MGVPKAVVETYSRTGLSPRNARYRYVQCSASPNCSGHVRVLTSAKYVRVGLIPIPLSSQEYVQCPECGVVIEDRHLHEERVKNQVQEQTQRRQQGGSSRGIRVSLPARPQRLPRLANVRRSNSDGSTTRRTSQRSTSDGSTTRRTSQQLEQAAEEQMMGRSLSDSRIAVSSGSMLIDNEESLDLSLRSCEAGIC